MDARPSLNERRPARRLAESSVEASRSGSIAGEDSQCCSLRMRKRSGARFAHLRLPLRTNLNSERRGCGEALAPPGGAAEEDATVELKPSSCSVGRAATSAVVDETAEADDLGNYAEVSADFSSSHVQKCRSITPSSAKDHWPDLCNPYIPIAAEMTGRFSSPNHVVRQVML